MNIKKLNFGLIGTGSIAEDAHAPSLTASGNASLHSVFSRNLLNAAELATKYSTSEFTVSPHQSLECFLNDELMDAVIVAVPDQLHFYYAEAALNAGKHVLVEKPMTTSIEQANRLIECANKNRLVLGVGYHMRFHPGIEKIINLVEDGELGSLRHMIAQWTFHRADRSDWRASTELGKWWSLAGTGSHCIDICNRIAEAAGLEFKCIEGVIAGGVLTETSDELVTAVVSYTGTCSAAITSSVLFDAPTVLNIYGDKGYIETRGLLARRSDASVLLNGKQISYAYADPFINQVDAFCNAIKSGSTFSSHGGVGLNGVSNLFELTNEYG